MCVPKQDGFLAARNYCSDGHGDLTGHKDFAAPWRLVIEKDAVACVHIVRLAIIFRQPERHEF